ncbi:hypothetical protein vBBak6_021 [Bacillus phage v_B-Bak6]|uniref:Uncharacterized protein n=1 Tax=Bacillus phage Basilisk TaxID=1296654 RepID=S5MSD7_9CAUD|nr:hypothetical protein PP653_gp138 [Bacillus phage Basilisk]AGR46717.1 hypothetical protein BASILISK_29 [Bacillus phage Basilisk]AXY82981.1 hypothetical protein vBBak1_021 [Bacillus phage v_B-Bak1]AXY83101.1 hypothetical protein vBBak6_021 [Bacillus phage v_B-Bak6]
MIGNRWVSNPKRKQTRICFFMAHTSMFLTGAYVPKEPNRVGMILLFCRTHNLST